MYLRTVLSKLHEASPTQTSTLFALSDGLLASFQSALQTSAVTMLPSFTEKLPVGTESGTTVALDLGGSTLRVAVVQLRPHARIEGSDTAHLDQLMHVAARQSWLVDEPTKKLPADDFFDWIAARISSVLRSAGLGDGGNRSFGVTWSFPVEPTSAASGKVQQMGKGYEQWRTIADTDLKAHFDAALRRQGVRLRMTSLMNDTEATLLSHAYANPATRLSLIWGTGLNAAVFLPLTTIGRERLAGRPTEWLRNSEAVVVNTEVSMFGKDLLPLSQADLQLDASSKQPGFQPLEQLTSGRYLGEICRLILVEAIQRKELFSGAMPKGLEVQFSFDTSICSAFEEADPSRGPEALTKAFDFPNAPTAEDIAMVRLICDAISTRSASLIATMLFSLHRLQRDNEVALPGSDSDAPIAIAFCGAVAEKHATALKKAQRVLDALVTKEAETSGRKNRLLVLEAAGDSGLLGAAVGAVMQEMKEPVRARL